MGRRLRNTVLENIRVDDFASEGRCVSRSEDKVLFTPFTAPGDVVDVRIREDKKAYRYGEVTHFHRYSDLRIPAKCAHFGSCGGCKWQHISYNQQLEFKQNQVADTLRRIGKIELPEPTSILGNESDFAYRNKLEFAFSDQRWLTREELDAHPENKLLAGLGFHVAGHFDKILHIDQCYLMENTVNRIRNRVYQFAREREFTFYNVRSHTGFLRQLSFRNNLKNEWMVTVMFAEDHADAIQDTLAILVAEFPEIVSLYYLINNKKNDSIYDQELLLFHGSEGLEEWIGSLRFVIGPKSFFQTNPKQTLRLYQQALEYAGVETGQLVYDLYSGIGTISLFLAQKAKFVVGIESVPEAVEDAWKNAERNNIQNVEFLAGDMKDLFNPSLLERTGKPEVVVTDPPRAGMHEAVVNQLLELSPERIVYVSCNPATQARDLQLLDTKYAVSAWRPVDMFPQTHHTENVVLLEMRK